MKKEIIYQLRSVSLNLGMTYKTNKKLKFGSIISLFDEKRDDNILWRVTGIAEQ